MSEDKPNDTETKTREPQVKQVDTGRNSGPTQTSKSEAPKREDVVEKRPESYVWLCDGSVVRADNEDLPGPAGVADPLGHWQRDGKVYTIVGVYPVEIDVKG